MAFETQADIAAKRASWSSNQAASERAPAATGTITPRIDPSRAAAQERQAQVEREAGINTTTQVNLQAEQAKTAGTTKPAPAVITSNAATTRNETNQAELAATQDNIAESNANAGTTPTTTPPPTTPQNTNTATSGTTTQTGTQTPAQPTVDPLQTQIDAASSTIDAEYNQTIGLLDARMASLDASTQAKIKSIQASYAVRREETKRLNQILLQGNTKAGIRAGRDRYAAEINQGILTDVEQQGLRRISELDAEEMELITAAQAANDENQFNLLASKMEQIHAKRKEKEEAISKLHADAMAAEQAAFQRAKDMREMQKWDREDASASVDAMVASGMDPASVPQEYFNKLDSLSGFVPGTAEGMMNVAQAERNAKSEADFIQNFDAVLDLTSKLRPDQFIDFNGSRYWGDKTDNEFIGYEVDKATGNIVSISRNLVTGEVTSSTQTGVLEPNVEYDQQWIDNGDGTESLWYVPADPKFKPVPVNPNVGTSSGGIDSGAIQEAWPNGFSLANGGAEAGLTQKDFWCLRWAGNLDVRGDALINEIGDTIQSKRASVEANIGFGAGAERPPQAGDYILTNESPDWGHVAYISEIRTDPTTGKRVAVLSESNYTAGTVTHTRTMELSAANMESNGGKILGFKHSELKPEYSSQPEQGGPSFSRPTEEAKKTADTETSSFGRAKDTKYLGDADKIIGNLTQNTLIKEFPTVYNGYQTSSSVPDVGSNAQQQTALVFAFMKLLDPDSVVREGEFATAQKYDGLLNQLGVKFNNIQKGKVVSDDVVKNIKAEMDRIYNERLTSYNSALDGYVSQAENFRIDPEDITAGLLRPEAPTDSAPAKTPEALIAKYPDKAADIRSALNAKNPDGSAKYTLEQVEEALK